MVKRKIKELDMGKECKERGKEKINYGTLIILYVSNMNVRLHRLPTAAAQVQNRVWSCGIL
jgi:hypothetical protein